ncbi:MAG: hypothetical protein D6B27_02530 [Gammaproteobacteria bacterium]|nr:MAG: hypothetical protein D6B27_02530 [Gammaproteobacteria bacterium]
MSDNPYKSGNSSNENDSRIVSEFGSKFSIKEPTRKPFIYGWLWVQDAINILKKNPVFWVRFSLYYFALSLFLPNLIIVLNTPVLSFFIQTFLGFVLLAFFSIYAFKVDINKLDGIDSKGAIAKSASSFLTLTAVYLLSFIVVIVVIGGILGIYLKSIGFWEGIDFSNADSQVTQEQILNRFQDLFFMQDDSISNEGFKLILIFGPVFALFILLITMLFFYAPILIVFNKCQIFQAMSLSFKAFIVNVIPFALYGVIVIGVFSPLVIFLFEDNLFVLRAIFIILTIPLNISIYTSYRDIFSLSYSADQDERGVNRETAFYV